MLQYIGLTRKMVEEFKEYPEREEMVRHLTEFNLGYEPEKEKVYNWTKIAKRKDFSLETYWLACKLTNNKGDISKIETLPYADLWTCSFPCTDISLAGKMRGLEADSGTRSSLLWENIRLLKRAKQDGILPKYIMFENVKGLVSNRFMGNFQDLLSVLDELGYNTYWDILNSKHCGVPQNRERLFAMAIRKDIDLEQFQNTQTMFFA